jgi:hypothetical protein
MEAALKNSTQGFVIDKKKSFYLGFPSTDNIHTHNNYSFGVLTISPSPEIHKLGGLRQNSYSQQQQQ